MVHVVRHFGDQEDSGARCGICDVCAPERCVARRFREPSDRERGAIARILASLGRSGAQPTGRLHRETFAEGTLDRRSFEHLLGGLAKAGLILLEETSFEKDGKEIVYQRASLTESGARQGAGGARITLPRTPPKTRKRPPTKRAEGKTKRSWSGKRRTKER
jgi:DNA-binding transcriptional ArsR family regulator